MDAAAGDLTTHGSWGREAGTFVGRTMPLPVGVALPFVIAAESYYVHPSTQWDPHVHPAHELVWVRGGTMTARVGRQVFTVPDGSALWVPAGEVHAGRLTARVRLLDAFFSPERTPTGFSGPAIVTMTPVLDALLDRLARTDLTTDERTRTEAVVFDVLEPSDHPLAVVLPEGPTAAQVATALLDDPADPRSLDRWARELGVSTRTVTRAFRTETGLSFTRWRQAARIHRAVAMLAEGTSVQDVSDALGYAHPGTFIEAFRRLMGTTPGAFVQQHRPMSENPHPVA